MSRRLLASAVLVAALPAAGQVPGTAPSVPPAAAPTALREVVETARHPWLRWPDFGDYRRHVSDFYAKVGSLLAAFMDIEREAFDMLEAEAR